MVEPPTDPDHPLDRLTQRHEAIVLDEELADLPEHYRAAIVMHCYEDRPLQSLAEHFGTTVGSIRGRLQRGKQLLAQRLRRRGVVPVIAFAAAEAWQISDAKGAQAADQFIESTSGGSSFPDPPIDTSLLESLLSQGVRLMPSLYTAFGLIGGSALFAAILTSNGNDAPRAPIDASQQVITLPADSEVVAQFNANVAIEPPTQDSASVDASQFSGMGAEFAGGLGGGMQSGLGGAQGGSPPAAGPFTQWTQKAVAPTPTSNVAKEVMARLDAEVELNASTTLAELPQVLQSALEIPVLIDDRGLAFAKQTGEVSVQFSGKQPLRTALRSILRPMGLQAIVEEEGLVITADPAQLVHQGIGADRWINIDEEAEEAISAKLEEDIQMEFVEVPVADMLKQLQDIHKLPVVMDLRALEEIGLSADEPISISAENISLRNFLDLALRELDLTYTIRGESLLITTNEAAEDALLSRIYWLEGTGIADTDFNSVTETIQTTIAPDTWEALGGPSTMNPLRSTRPGIVIRTTYTNHQSIERLLEAMRETHFGSEPVLEQVPVPASPSGVQGTMGGFGGGMGGGGMF